MPSGTLVPVTPSVVKWAIDESGFTPAALATAIGVPLEILRGWAIGLTKPHLGDLRRLASQLDRPLATFLLPSPPAAALPQVEFRSLPTSSRRPLYPIERLRLREAARLQRMLSWISRELQEPQFALPRLRISSDPGAAAAETRQRLRVTSRLQQSWNSPAGSLRGWRGALEDSGVFVLLISLTEDAYRGFSLWDDYAPLVAANTAYSPEARVFTLFHEYAHLLTRTPSACVEGNVRRASRHDDPAERWCERFAAAVILPPEEIRAFIAERGVQRGQRVTDLDLVRATARHFKASLRATTLSLIEAGAATWGLYASLPGVQAERRAPGGGGAGRDRGQIKLDQYGTRAFDAFAVALQQDVVSRGDVLDYLDVPPQVLPQGRRSAGFHAERE